MTKQTIHSYMMTCENVKTTFLYTLSDPETGKIRYLGKSDNPFKRYRKHLTDKNPSHKVNWISQLRSKGLAPFMDLLDEVPETQWEFWEREYIRVFKAIGFDLVNQRSGGAGAVGGEKAPFKGRKHSPETLEKMRINNRGSNHPLFGKHHSRMARGKISAATVGDRNPFFGRKHSLESLEKMRAASTGVRPSKETRDKVGSASRDSWSFRKLPHFSDGGGI